MTGRGMRGQQITLFEMAIKDRKTLNGSRIHREVAVWKTGD